MRAGASEGRGPSRSAIFGPGRCVLGGDRRGQVAGENRTGICGAGRGRWGSQRRDFGEEEAVWQPRPSRHGEAARRDAKFGGRKRVGMGVRL